MRTSVPFFSLSEVPDDLADCDGACCPGAGLCCPDDPLDDVLRYFPVVDDGFLEVLGVAASSPHPAGRGNEDGASKAALGAEASGAPGGGGEPDTPRGLSLVVPEVQEFFDVDMFFADDGGGGDPNVSNNMSCHAVTTSAALPAGGLEAHAAADGFVSAAALPLPAGGLDALGALDGFVSAAAPQPPPAHDELPAGPLTTSSTSTGSLWPTIWETESPPAPPVSLPPAWVVPPRKQRRRRPVVRRNPSWLPKSLLHDVPVPVSTPHDNPCSHNGNDAVVIRRQPPPQPRQRNRQAQRACTHCGNTDTPQWRAGPRGPGTLCNACGIRFKNGKLLPEYRPSTSPSFRSGEHSNRHRKVVKLREQKAKEKFLKLISDTVPAPPNGGEFMDMCTYIATGQ